MRQEGAGFSVHGSQRYFCTLQWALTPRSAAQPCSTASGGRLSCHAFSVATYPQSLLPRCQGGLSAQVARHAK